MEEAQQKDKVNKPQPKRLLVRYFEAKGYALIDIIQGYLWYWRPDNPHFIFISVYGNQVFRGNLENLEDVTGFFTERAEAWREKMEMKKTGCGK